MGKRKRDIRDEGAQLNGSSGVGEKPAHSQQNPKTQSAAHMKEICVQVITGSYDRVLHGFTAAIDLSRLSLSDDVDSEDGITFTDTFLFNAHASAIRCLALSPTISDSSRPDAPSKIILASGSTDERINLYAISANAPSQSHREMAVSLPSLNSVAKMENPKNREIGSLLHHSSTVTKLRFATKSKLISASEDNTIAISRTRDWSVLTTLKAPVPQAHGRPSGDTAAPGKTPAGVNDFDFDPSMKIMISTGRGERCMRLWNLVTGKKAGALNFSKNLLQAVGESKFHSGEGRNVIFDPSGEAFVVGFERSAVVFNMQSEIQGLVTPAPRTKIHRIKFLPGRSVRVLAISTEDGRIVLYDVDRLEMASRESAKSEFATYKPFGQIGGPAAGVSTRIKDFEFLPLPSKSNTFLVITAGSDGSTRIWYIKPDELKPTETPLSRNKDSSNESRSKVSTKPKESPQMTKVGRLLGRFDTANRITCLQAFIMMPTLSDEKSDFSIAKSLKQSKKNSANGAEILSEAVRESEAAEGEEEDDDDDDDGSEGEEDFEGFD